VSYNPHPAPYTNDSGIPSPAPEVFAWNSARTSRVICVGLREREARERGERESDT